MKLKLRLQLNRHLPNNKIYRGNSRYIFYTRLYKYIHMKNVTKLTSVNVLEDVYNKFKVKAVNSEINLQKLVNRSLDLYNNDETFRDKVNNHDNLKTTGTKF